jgi:hypothetical protein
MEGMIPAFAGMTEEVGTTHSVIPAKAGIQVSGMAFDFNSGIFAT